MPCVSLRAAPGAGVNKETGPWIFSHMLLLMKLKMTVIFCSREYHSIT